MAKNKGVSLSEIAIGYVLNYANVYGMDTYALVGAVTGNEVELNAKACDIVLTKEEMEWLDLKR